VAQKATAAGRKAAAGDFLHPAAPHSRLARTAAGSFSKDRQTREQAMDTQDKDVEQPLGRTLTYVRRACAAIAVVCALYVALAVGVPWELRDAPPLPGAVAAGTASHPR
jgi:hypothetical protein